MSAIKNELAVSWDEFHRYSKTLGWQLAEKGVTWKGIIAVTRGGLVPACIVAQVLDVKLVDTVCISSYDYQNQRTARIIKPFDAGIEEGGAGWLVVDDLADTGNTAKIIRDMLPQVHLATVYAKPKGLPFVDTFTTMLGQETWIHFPWELSNPLYEGPIVSAGKKA
jgi:xanthine phosphoribosyltransferase